MTEMDAAQEIQMEARVRRESMKRIEALDQRPCDKKVRKTQAEVDKKQRELQAQIDRTDQKLNDMSIGRIIRKCNQQTNKETYRTIFVDPHHLQLYDR